MVVTKPDDLLQYLAHTGPISADELATRTSSELAEFAGDLLGLIEAGDVEIVEGNAKVFQSVLSAAMNRSNGHSTAVRRDFFRALEAQEAHDTKLGLSSRGFRKARSMAAY